MPPTCNTCQRDDVKEINGLLVSGISLRNIGQQFSIEHTALFRHKESCIPQLFARRDKKLRDGLLKDLDAVKAEIDEVKAEFGSNGLLRDRLIGRKFTAIELEAKLTGQFKKEGENPESIDDIVAKRLLEAGYDEAEARRIVSERYQESDAIN